MKTFKDLDAYTMALEVARVVYFVSKQFPKEELFGLTSQMRRAAVSISSNIAEGMGRRTNKDLIHFLYIARGSNFELVSQIDIARLLDYISESNFRQLMNVTTKSGKCLSGLIKYFENKV